MNIFDDMRVMDRREFLWKMGTVAVSTFLFKGTSRAAAPTVSMLEWQHFVPTRDPELKRQVAAWAKSRGVNAKVDFIDLRRMPAVLAAEVEARKGHDIANFFNFSAALHKQNLVDMDDVAEELGGKYGPWLQGAVDCVKLDGRWKAIPMNYQSLLANINVDNWKKIGMSTEDVMKLNWDGLLEKAKELHKIGHPIGLVIAEDFDSYSSIYPLLLSFGGKPIDENNKIVIDSPQTRQALEYARELFPYMPREMLGWDGGGNNRFILSGVGSWTPNPPSIWAVAKLKKLHIAEKIDHVPMPAGPAGRFRGADFNNLGIWKFSPNIELAKDLIKFLMSKGQLDKHLEAAMGYNQPTLAAYDKLTIWKDQKALRYYHPPVETTIHQLWPAKPSPALQISYNLLVLPIMFIKAVTNRLSINDSVKWAEKQFKRIYTI
ncbi:MAG: extracellular solute-binding protein [Deltaproteobacteria bacterium]|nr:extracellular solute-binding protein [Deltaproteobacteria bacterium]MBW1961018.1 extracellular solute-binding protein [Deltaproteobacteria bacterium]MBW1995547.1 extracellular solute-binding protein [Deltaproteobacteria bacterium]MBW2152785.1 extracellular solute-binding protein [Deltaproteobacteria bacterium]